MYLKMTTSKPKRIFKKLLRGFRDCRSLRKRHNLMYIRREAGQQWIQEIYSVGNTTANIQTIYQEFLFAVTNFTGLD